MLAHAGRPEVVRHRPDSKDEIVVADAVPPDNLAAVLDDRGDDDLAAGAVDRLERPVEEAVIPALGVTAVADLVEVGVERPGRDLVEERLPDVRLLPVDQDDVIVDLAERAAELRHQLESPRAAADDDDLRLLRPDRRHVHPVPPAAAALP